MKMNCATELEEAVKMRRLKKVERFKNKLENILMNHMRQFEDFQ